MEIRIATPRTILKNLLLEDTSALFAYRSLQIVWEYQGWYPQTLEDAEAFIRKHSIETKGKVGEWVQLGIYDRENGSLLGDCGYHVMSDTEAEIGYTLAPESQGTGYATEIVTALLDYLYTQAHFTNITASVDPDNAPSIRVLEKTGFHKDRLSRQSIEIRGEWKDDLIFEHERSYKE